MRHDRLPARDAVLIVGLLALSSLVAVARAAAERKKCIEHKCPEYNDCQRVNDKDICMCPLTIPLILMPVCGSNGKSYDNPWELAARTCHLKDGVKMDHLGNCNKTSDPCSTVDCWIHGKCEVVEGKPKCVQAECPKSCPDPNKAGYSGDALCGNDGITYRDLCMFKMLTCNKHAIVKHRGECQRNLEPMGRAFKRSNATESTCNISCPDKFKPVCGSNGITYNNECFLKKNTCHLYDKVRVAHQGECKKTSDPCSTVDCHIHDRCLVVRGRGRCVPDCPKSCPPDVETGTRSLCGSDGNTYRNLCELRLKSCSLKKFILVKHKRRCRTDNRKPPTSPSSTRRPKHRSSERPDAD